MYLISTPVFRASFTGALKNLLDHVPVEGLQGKACGLIGMGATDHHYLSIDAQLRPVLAWFGALVAPGMVYLQSRHFQDGQLADPQAVADLQSLARSVMALHRAVAGFPALLPSPPADFPLALAPHRKSSPPPETPNSSRHMSRVQPSSNRLRLACALSPLPSSCLCVSAPAGFVSGRGQHRTDGSLRPLQGAGQKPLSSVARLDSIRNHSLAPGLSL